MASAFVPGLCFALAAEVLLDSVVLPSPEVLLAFAFPVGDGSIRLASAVRPTVRVLPVPP